MLNRDEKDDICQSILMWLNLEETEYNKKCGVQKEFVHWQIIYDSDCPQQKNDFDCGIFALNKIEVLLFGQEKEMQSAIEYREKLIDEILFFAKKEKPDWIKNKFKS